MKTEICIVEEEFLVDETILNLNLCYRLESKFVSHITEPATDV